MDRIRSNHSSSNWAQGVSNGLVGSNGPSHGSKVVSRAPIGSPPTEAHFPPLLGRSTISTILVDTKCKQSIDQLRQDILTKKVSISADHEQALGSVDVTNQLGLWTSPKKPRILPKYARFAMMAVLTTVGYPGLKLLWGPQDALLMAFRNRCAATPAASWQEAGSLDEELRQMLAFLWTVGQGAYSTLLYKDSCSKAFHKDVVLPLLAVMAAGGLQQVAAAARILATGQTQGKRTAWISGLELSCQDPQNFINTSPLAAATQTVSAATSALQVLRPVEEAPTFNMSADRFESLPATNVALTSQHRGSCVASPAHQPVLPPVSIASPAMKTNEAQQQAITVNGQHVVLDPIILRALAYDIK